MQFMTRLIGLPKMCLSGSQCERIFADFVLASQAEDVLSCQ